MSVNPNTTDPNLQIPDKSILYQIAGSAYSPDFNDVIEGFTLLKQTPTLKFFKKVDYPVIVVGVRGTADLTDFQAWLPVVLNKIAGTERYTTDTAVLTDFQQDYLPNLYYYYATGHSIAGVIIDEWLKRGLILGARTYNPAIQEGDLQRADINNYRVYVNTDPLYRMFGRRATRTPEVRESKLNFGLDQAKQFFLSPLYYWGKDTMREHSIRNPTFFGGRFQER